MLPSHFGISKLQYSNNYSYLFDGINERINIDSVITNLATTTKGTWCAWVKIPSGTSTRVIFAFSHATSADYFFLTLNLAGDNNLRGTFYLTGTVQWNLHTDTDIPINVWTHTALVQDGTSPVLYVNGVAVAQTFTITTNKTRWFNSYSAGVITKGRIGSIFSTSDSSFFNGNIDEVGLFNTNLTAGQITEIYNNGKPKNLLKHSAVSNLVSYFRMGDGDTWDGTNFTLIDKKGTNNGTSVNLELTDKELSDVP